MQYTGSKNGSGLWQFIINHTPEHSRYFELFAGSGAIFQHKKPAQFNLLNDLNEKCIAHLSAVVDKNGYGSTTTITKSCAMAIIDKNVYNSGDFLYLDPPYPFESRRSGARHYKYELKDQEHIELLRAIKTCKAHIMISTKQNTLYDTELSGWNKKTFKTSDHQGVAFEQIFMNYEIENMRLHQYDQIGTNATDRQRIKRKLSRWENKLSTLPTHEKLALLEHLKIK